FAATLADIATGIAARRRVTGEGWLRATRTVLSLGRQRFGGLVVHLGIVLIGAGMIASGLFQTAVTVSLKPGDSFELAGRVVTLRDVADADGANYRGRAAVLSVSQD